MSATLHDFEVLACKLVAEDIWHMSIHTEVAAALQPGQFVNIHVPGDGAHILRVPLSFSNANGRNGIVDLYFATVGEGTRRLAAMAPGDRSTLVGPCGNGWKLPTEGGRALLVAGGIGLPPIVAAARMLATAGIGFDAVVGAHTATKHVEDLIDCLRTLSKDEGCDCARKVVLTTDDGTRGIAGFTTQAMEGLLAENAYACVYTCGRHAMMAGVANIAKGRGIACQVSMEAMMGCGFGACSCCNVALVSGGYALCCSDGPVFDAEEVAW